MGEIAECSGASQLQNAAQSAFRILRRRPDSPHRRITACKLWNPGVECARSLGGLETALQIALRARTFLCD